MKIKTLEELGISPAPWRAESSDVLDAKGSFIVDASMFTRTYCANARMFAAAPKLYQRLAELIDACGKVGYKDGGTAACYASEHRLYDALWNARAALAEAGGVESEARK